jgi:putative hydrolase of the HAD superfamily
VTDAMGETHLIFDLDDTLYAERDYAIGGFRAAVAWARSALGVEIGVDRMLALLDDGQLGKLFQAALVDAKPDHTTDDLKGFVRAYGQQTPEIRLFDDAAEALAYWHPRAKLGLITDGHAATQHAKISALALAPKFEHIIATGALGPERQFHKPHPRAFEQMQTALGLSGDRFVYVGDNLSKDFVAPNALGWTSILIDRPAHRAHRIHKNTSAPSGGEPHVVIHDLVELQRVLE